VADKVLEDVELAFLAKRRRWVCVSAMPGCGVHQDVRSTGAMVEGWTKNLALLFDNSLALAVWRALISFSWWAFRCWRSSFGARILPPIRWNGWARVVLALLWRGRCFGFMRGCQVELSLCGLCAGPLGCHFSCAALPELFQHRILKRVSWKDASTRVRGTAFRCRPMDVEAHSFTGTQDTPPPLPPVCLEQIVSFQRAGGRFYRKYFCFEESVS